MNTFRHTAEKMRQSHFDDDDKCVMIIEEPNILQNKFRIVR